jgi:predicted dithiol-disulfide oxidoreductase (DUF899 family)
LIAETVETERLCRKSGEQWNEVVRRWQDRGARGYSLVFHTYSCYSRGIDMLNGAYHYLDPVPKGRDEDRFKLSMEWLRRHDQY